MWTWWCSRCVCSCDRAPGCRTHVRDTIARRRSRRPRHAGTVISEPDRTGPERTGAERTRSRTQRVDYSLVEHAGRPHRGVTTGKETVRANLDAVNERLAREGHRQIDLVDARWLSGTAWRTWPRRAAPRNRSA